MNGTLEFKNKDWVEVEVLGGFSHFTSSEPSMRQGVPPHPIQ